MPSLLAVSLHRYRIELLQFRRTGEAVFFTLAFPPVMLVLFGTIFHDTNIGPAGSPTSFAQYFAAGMIGSAIWASCFQNMAIAVPLERDSGALKRLRGTPMPRAAYFLGKVLFVLTVTALDCAIVLAIGALFFDLHWPPVANWLTFAWVLALGSTACTMFGLGLAGLIRHGRSASAIVVPIAVLLQFVSGVYFVYGNLPQWLRDVGAVFPLAWITQGMRSVFLPDGFRFAEPAHSWQHPLGALVLVLWCVAGLAVTVRTFRWTPTFAD